MMNARVLQFVVPAALLLTASIAQGAIYRCAQAGGGVLYSDSPCQGGAVVDIHPGSADPNAQERLARARAELDRAATERRAQEQFEAAQREQMRREAQYSPSVAPQPAPDPYYGTTYDFAPSYVPYAPIDRLHDGNRRGDSHGGKRRESRVPQVVRTPHPPN
jgi:uncharacterized protein DUF4124